MREKEILVFSDRWLEGYIQNLTQKRTCYLFEGTSDAKAAYTRVRDFTPDLLIVNMVHASPAGKELVARISGDETLEKMPVLIIGQPDMENLNGFHYCGNNITKISITIDRLLRQNGKTS